jgi:hypothetical protein
MLLAVMFLIGQIIVPHSVTANPGNPSSDTKGGNKDVHVARLVKNQVTTESEEKKDESTENNEPEEVKLEKSAQEIIAIDHRQQLAFSLSMATGKEPVMSMDI